MKIIVDHPANCCVKPITDVYNNYYVFSQLGAGLNYSLFQENPGTCFESREGREVKSWGNIKGLFK